MARRLARIASLLDSVAEAYARESNDAALILLYSVLDVLGTVNRDTGNQSGNGEGFRKWVNQYVLSAGNLDVSAEDLWAARCGIVHALSHESTLTNRRKARVIIYMRGVESAPNGGDWSRIMKQAIERVPAVSRTPPDQLAVVHLGSLIAAVRNGFERYSDEVLSSDELDRRLTERLEIALTTITVSHD